MTGYFPKSLFPEFMDSDLNEWQKITCVVAGAMSFYYACRWLRRNRNRGNCSLLKDKVVCITGASGGLGKALAQVLTKRGARTVLTGRSEEALQHVVYEIMLCDPLSRDQPEATFVHEPAVIQMDMSNLDEIPAKAKEILDAFGTVDVVIHNAGISSRGSILENSFAVDLSVMNTNYLGPVALTKELLPAMIKNGSGSFVAISSVQGRLSIPFRSSYSASKHAMQAFFDCLRAEMDNIHVLVVSPSYIKTGLSLHALRGEGRAHGKMDETTAHGMDADVAAERIVQGIENGEQEILLMEWIPARIGIYLRTIWPSLCRSLMRRRARKQLETS